MSTKINIPSWLIQVQTVIIFQTLHVFNTQMIFALIFKNICRHKISKPLLCLWKISSKQYAIWFCPPISIYMFYLFILNGQLNIKINKDTPTHHWPRSKPCTFVWIQKVSAQFEQTPICIPRPARADQLQLPVTPVTAVYAHLQVYVHERAQWAQCAQSAELIHFVHPNEHQHRAGDYSCCCS